MCINTTNELNVILINISLIYYPTLYNSNYGQHPISIDFAIMLCQ